MLLILKFQQKFLHLLHLHYLLLCKFPYSMNSNDHEEIVMVLSKGPCQYYTNPMMWYNQ